ncbi:MULTISPECIES: TRAP transporter substrate-binding protein [unclassified Nitrospina]|uniref:TRAP transporter substrate-binding protein n=1 Tax=unclassified Nitrospina TaxID=2638683 RepID=UPI003F99EBE3
MNIILKYGSIWPDNHFFREIEIAFTKEIRESSNLIVKIIPYQDESLIIEDLMNNNLHIAGTSSIVKLVPEASLMYLPYLYNSFTHYKRVWTSNTKITRKIEDIILKRTNLIVLGYSLVGSRDTLLKSKPIETLEDFQNLKIRIDGAQISKEIFSSLKATPIVIPYHDVSVSFKNSIIDAVENSPFNFIRMSWNKHASFVSCTKHRYLLNFELIRADFFSKLKKQEQTSIKLAMKKYCENFATRAESERKSSIHNLIKSGIHLNKLSEDNINQISNATQKVVKNFAAKHSLIKEIKEINSMA